MKILQVLIITLTMSILCACGEEKCKVEIGKEKSVGIDLDSFPSLKKIVEDIEKKKTVHGSHIGEGGSPSSQWDKYEQLKKVATIDQLVALTDHLNPAVRCYSFQSLASRRHNKVFSLLLNHLHDTSRVEYLSGCKLQELYVGDYFINVVTPDKIEEGIYKLNGKERKLLDSVLINDKSILLYARSVIMETTRVLKEKD